MSKKRRGAGTKKRQTRSEREKGHGERGFEHEGAEEGERGVVKGGEDEAENGGLCHFGETRRDAIKWRDGKAHAKTITRIAVIRPVMERKMEAGREKGSTRGKKKGDTRR